MCLDLGLGLNESYPGAVQLKTEAFGPYLSQSWRSASIESDHKNHTDISNVNHLAAISGLYISLSLNVSTCFSLPSAPLSKPALNSASDYASDVALDSASNFASD